MIKSSCWKIGDNTSHSHRSHVKYPRMWLLLHTSQNPWTTYAYFSCLDCFKHHSPHHHITTWRSSSRCDRWSDTRETSGDAISTGLASIIRHPLRNVLYLLRSPACEIYLLDCHRKKWFLQLASTSTVDMGFERMSASFFRMWKCEQKSDQVGENVLKEKWSRVCAPNVLCLAGDDHLWIDREMRSVMFPLSDVWLRAGVGGQSGMRGWAERRKEGQG